MTSRNMWFFIFNEMKIKEDLVYNKNTGKLSYRFCEHWRSKWSGLELEQACNPDEPQHPVVAKHMLVFMVTFTHFHPWHHLRSALFYCLGGHQTIWVLWLQGHCSNMMGALWTEKFFRIHKPPTDKAAKKPKKPKMWWIRVIRPQRKLSHQPTRSGIPTERMEDGLLRVWCAAPPQNNTKLLVTYIWALEEASTLGKPAYFIPSLCPYLITFYHVSAQWIPVML